MTSIDEGSRERSRDNGNGIIDVGSLSEAWRALPKIVAEAQKAVYDRVNREFESLEIGVSEHVAFCSCVRDFDETNKKSSGNIRPRNPT